MVADGLQGKLVLDQWLSYLRNGLSTCYYCVAPAAFAEELQRKCILHLRPPYYASSEEAHGGRDEDVKPEVDSKPDVGDEDGDNRYGGGDREGTSTYHGRSTKTAFPQMTGDEKWESTLDTKLRPLLEPVDVVEYGGRDVQE